MLDKIERLAAAGISLLPAIEITSHFVFERDGFVALVERRGAGFGTVGAAGLLTSRGIAPLIWRGDAAYFVAKNHEEPAAPEQINRLRAFQSDLRRSIE